MALAADDQLPVRSIMFAMATLILIAANASPSPAGEEALGRSVMMLLVLTMLLGAFLLAVALLTVLRRRRLRAMQAKPPSGPLPDPWKEAAGRVQLDPLRKRR